MDYLFRSKCSSTGDFTGGVFDATGETVGITTSGWHGDALVFDTNNTEFTEVSVRVDLSAQNARRLHFYYKIDSSGDLTGDLNIAHVWRGFYTADLLQIQIKRNAADDFNLRIYENDGMTSDAGTTTMVKGTWYKIVLEITDSAMRLYLDNNKDAECEITGLSLTGYNLGVTALGKFFGAGLDGLSYMDNIAFYEATPTPATTITDKLAQAYQGILERYLSFEGGVIRSKSDGIGGQFDMVSEGVGYIMLMAVRQNDQDTFNLVEEFAYNNLERRHNPSFDGDAGNMMAFLFSNTTNSVTDWTEAPDGDIDRAKALYMAHTRWGSTGTINYLGRANTIAQDIIDFNSFPYGGNYYLTGNHFEAVKVIGELNPSYFDPQFYYMAKTYHNATEWQKHIDGSLIALDKSTDNLDGIPTTAGLPPDWCGIDSADGDIVDPPNPGRVTKYLYDAVRTPWRQYLGFLINGDTGSGAILERMYGHWDSEWDTHGVFYMEYNHDGTDNGTPYEKVLSYACNIFNFIANDPSDSRIATIYAKVTNSFQQHPAGAYWSDNPNTPTSDNPSYFNSTVVQLTIYAKENDFDLYASSGAGDTSGGGSSQACGLIPNSSFEVDTNGWQFDAAYSRSADNAYAGTWSMKLVATSGFANFYTINNPTGLSVLPNTVYELEFYVNIDTQDTGVGVQINTGSAFGTAIVEELMPSTFATWQKKTLQFNSDNNTNVWIRFYNNDSNVTAYFDAFCLRAKPSVLDSSTYKHYAYKVFDGDSYVTTWSKEVLSEPVFRSNINTGYSDMNITLARQFDDFGEDIDVKLNNRVEIYVYDRESVNGLLIYTGYITGYAPELQEAQEFVTITLFPYDAQLGRMILRDGSGNTTLAYNSQDPANILTDVLDKFRARGGRLHYTASSIQTTNTTVSYTFNTNTVRECLDKIIELCPVGWYYSIDPDGLVNLKPKSAVPIHDFLLGKHVIGLKTYRRIEDLVNRVLFTGAGDPALFRVYENTGSQNQYGLYEKRLVDQRVSLAATAQILSEREIETKKDPEIRSTFIIADSNGPSTKLGYDIESIKVGQTVRVKNLNTGVKSASLWDQALWDVDVWDQTLATSAADIIQILSVSYEPDRLIIEASSRLPQIAKRVEDISRNLENSQTVNNPTAPS